MVSMVLPIILLTALLVSRSASAQSDKSASNDRGNVRQAPVVQGKQARADGSIKGRVVGEGGRPVADASIVAFPVSVFSNPQGMLTSMFRPVSSDADGKFELTGLHPGAYTVATSALGYVLSESDSKAFHRPGESVTLTLTNGGVITGKVTNSSGDPVVLALVRAIRVRDIDNRPARPRGNRFSDLTERMNDLLGEFKTDDRGIYRIYGLAPGYYQVAAGGRSEQGFSFGGGAYDSDAPTYYPSSTIDTAGEVAVRAGDEALDIDIRYRDNRGHSISGAITGLKGLSQEGNSVVLTRASNGIVEGTTIVMPSRSEKGFAFNALLDGEYFVTAMAASGGMLEGAELMNASVSQPRRVTLSGEDVTGVELTLEPLSSIAGRVLIEPLQDAAQKTECKSNRKVGIEEVVLRARSEGKHRPEDQSIPFLMMFKDTTPNEKGEFTLGFLRPGGHRLAVELPGEHLYMKSTTLAPANSNAKPIDAAKNGFALKSGDKIKGLVVTLSEGAAGLRGKVVTGEENKPPQSKMRVHLVPAEPEAVDEVLRYFEAELATDGRFSLMNIAPGKYWLVAREVSDHELAEVDHKPLAWDAGERMGLRFEGEASKKVIELARCQRITEFVLKYTPLIRPTKAPTKE